MSEIFSGDNINIKISDNKADKKPSSDFNPDKPIVSDVRTSNSEDIFEYKNIEQNKDVDQNALNPEYNPDKPLVLTEEVNFSQKRNDNGNEYIRDGKLLPNNEYTLNGNVYKTDENGRIVSCESKPRLTPENPRDNDSQILVGDKYRKSGDQGGHIIGRDIGGDGGIGNLIPMDSRINQSDYKRMENKVKSALNEGKDVTTKTEISYIGDSERPDKIITTVTVDGKETVYTFDNNIDGSLMDKVKETCNESDTENLQSVLDEISGKISSVIEVYDADGKHEKTIAWITYIWDGSSYRRYFAVNHNGGNQS